ncbi:hypothetical protein AVEN_185448-1 [Araneus ventricosus]|uniref:Uncharacterized protein n=1 Tax=Araneus ventricosus TaxID=182803 RepID=A0A4Y2NMQ9_ARAVE|nr:hypothetical protein AVEN_185448-1 [Araneus ventricosus]
MDVSNVSLSDFWEFEILGIYHAVKVESAETTYDEHFTALKEKLNILPDGRYKLELPFKDFFQNLPDNKELSWKRHEKMMQKLKWKNFLGDYQKVLDEWETLNIIERVPEGELGNKCHHLPHRPVIKMIVRRQKFIRYLMPLLVRKEDLGCESMCF